MTVTEIIERVATLTGIPADVITGPKRTELVCRARFLAAWGIRQKYPYLPLIEIAYPLGRIEHGFTIHALKRAEQLMSDPHFKAMADQLTANF